MASAQPSWFHTQMWKAERSSTRRTVHRQSTVRKSDGAPHDSLIQDLSQTGFRISGPVGLSVGDEILVGLAGVGICDAIVVWTDGDSAGCQFAEPISQAEIDKTVSANTVVEAGIARNLQPARQETPHAAPQHTPRRLSTRVRASIVLTAALGTWAVWIGAGFGIYALIA